MASTIHGVTVADVLARCAFDTANITANTHPVSTTIVDAHIEAEAGLINAILLEKGIDPADVAAHPDSLSRVKDAITYGAAIRTNETQGVSPQLLQEAREAHAVALNRLHKLQGATLGGANPASGADRADADPDNPRGRIVER